MLRVLSDIYPPHIKPVRDGWYLFRVCGLVSFSLREFSGGAWLYSDGWPTEDCLCDGWRGLAFDPKAGFAGLDAVTDRVGVFLPGATC